jgi:hypothetical protein
MCNTRALRTICLICFSIIPFCALVGQEMVYTAMIPIFHDRLNSSGRESLAQLRRQRFVAFVYRNAVAVSSEAEFVNTGSDSLFQEFALPSTGHEENGDEPGRRISNGLLSIQLWVEGERLVPEFTHEGNEDWYTIRARFAPGGRRTVRAVFWVQTSLADVDGLPGLDTAEIPVGKRGFVLDLSHATVWNNVIEKIDVTVVLRGGMTFQRDSFSAEPDAYDLQDSTIAWSFRNVEPSPRDNIIVSYTPSGPWGTDTNTMAKLATYIVGKGYENLLQYVRQLDNQRHD